MTKDEMLKEMFEAAVPLANKLKGLGVAERAMHTIAFDSSGYIYCAIKDGEAVEAMHRLSDRHEIERRRYE